MRVHLTALAIAWGLTLGVCVSPTAASLGKAGKPAAACYSDGDCPPGYLCTSMIYMGSSLSPICLAGPSQCHSDADCPGDYACDRGAWFHAGAFGLASDDSGTCSPREARQKTTIKFGRRHGSSEPN